MTTTPLCGARPQPGACRCDLPAGHDGDHSAPLIVGGRLRWRRDWRDHAPQTAPRDGVR